MVGSVQVRTGGVWVAWHGLYGRKRSSKPCVFLCPTSDSLGITQQHLGIRFHKDGGWCPTPAAPPLPRPTLASPSSIWVLGLWAGSRDAEMQSFHALCLARAGHARDAV